MGNYWGNTNHFTVKELKELLKDPRITDDLQLELAVSNHTTGQGTDIFVSLRQYAYGSKKTVLHFSNYYWDNPNETNNPVLTEFLWGWDKATMAAHMSKRR